MSNYKQSSVEWFWNQIPEILPFTVDTETAVKLLEAFEQAKAIHKQEIIATFKKAMNSGFLQSHTWTPQEGNIHKADYYYKETYKE